jgi:hypothetical protein
MLTSNNIIILVIQHNKDLIVKYGYSLAGCHNQEDFRQLFVFQLGVPPHAHQSKANIYPLIPKKFILINPSEFL